MRELRFHLGFFKRKSGLNWENGPIRWGTRHFGEIIFNFWFFFIAHNRRALSSSCLHLVFGGYSYFWRFDLEMILFFRLLCLYFFFAEHDDADGCNGWCLLRENRAILLKFLIFCSRDSRVWKNKWKLRSLLTRRAVSFLVFFYSLISVCQHDFISIVGSAFLKKCGGQGRGRGVVSISIA